MSWNDPDYVYRVRANANKNFLTDEQYANILKLLALVGYEPLTDSTGLIITKDSGEILYGKP